MRPRLEGRRPSKDGEKKDGRERKGSSHDAATIAAARPTVNCAWYASC
jgi:hypothetical protein